jgi:hypothetical protein
MKTSNPASVWVTRRRFFSLLNDLGFGIDVGAALGIDLHAGEDHPAALAGFQVVKTVFPVWR